MDIFTTQLTRIVQLPIKPASIKVKALLKEAANSKLHQDPDHLENHEYYFTSEEDQYHSNQHGTDHYSAEDDQNKQGDKTSISIESSSDKLDSDSSEDNANKNKGGTKHLDLYA